MDANEYVLKYLIEQYPNDEKLKKELELYLNDDDWELDLSRYLEPNELIDFRYRRHWEDCTAIEKMGDKWISYSWATTTGDESPSDKGWEFEPDFDFVEPYDEVVVVQKWRTV